MMHLSSPNELVRFLFQDFEFNSGNVRFPPTNSCPALSLGQFAVSCGAGWKVVDFNRLAVTHVFCPARRPTADPGGMSTGVPGALGS